MNTDSDFLYCDETDPFGDEIEPCCHACGEILQSETEYAINLCDACLVDQEYQLYQSEQNKKVQTVQDVERIVKKMTLYIPPILLQEWDKTLSDFLVAHHYRMPVSKSDHHVYP